MRTLLRWGAVFLLFTAVGQGAETPAQLFQQSLQRAYTVISDPEIAHEVKTMEVTELFQQLNHLCASNCDIVLNEVREANRMLGITAVPEVIEGYGRAAGVEEFSAEEIKEVSARLEHWLENTSHEKIQYQLAASLELVRFVVSIEERHLFDIASGNERQAEAEAALRKDLATMKTQAFALKTVIDLSNEIMEADGSLESRLTDDRVSRLVSALNDLGLFYLKFVQTFSNASFLLGESAVKHAKKFQDGVDPLEAGVVRRIVEAEFGAPLESIFESFNLEKPLASGTVGQTHEAVVRGRLGFRRRVVVKVQRPDLDRTLEWNHNTNEFLKGWATLMAPPKIAPILDVISTVITGIENDFATELDYRQEGLNTEKFKRFFRFNPSVKVPKVYWKYSSTRVLTLERVPGVNVERVAGTPAFDSDQRANERLFSRILDTFFYLTWVTKANHGDLHPGNLLVHRTEVNLIDFGNVLDTRGVVSRPVRLFFHGYHGNPGKVAQAFYEMAKSPEFGLVELETIAERNFREAGLEPQTFNRTASYAWRHRREIPMNEDRLAKLANALVGTFVDAVQQLGYRPSSSYIQFTRSLVPVMGTLVALGRNIPRARLYKIMAWKLITFYPKGKIQFLGGRAMDFGRRTSKDLVRSVHKSIRIRSARNCLQLFQGLSLSN